MKKIIKINLIFSLIFFLNIYSHAGAIISKDFSVNASKGSGEGAWVNEQTTLIARNGGSIEAENKVTNTGTVIGSLNEEEKLKVVVKEIEILEYIDNKRNFKYKLFDSKRLFSY